MYFVHVCVSVCIGVLRVFEYRCPQRPEDDIAFPGAGIIGGCEAPDVPNSGPFARAACTLNS